MSSSSVTKCGATFLVRRVAQQRRLLNPYQIRAVKSCGRAHCRNGGRRYFVDMARIDHGNDGHFQAGAIAALASLTTTAFFYDSWSLFHKDRIQDKSTSKSSNVVFLRIKSQSENPSDALYKNYYVDWRAPALGHGSFASVHLAHSVASGEPVALKRIHKRKTDKEAFAKETQAFLQMQKHNGGNDHIMKLRDLFEDDTYYYLVFDLAQGGEVFEDLIQNGPYTEAEAARVIHQLASALDFIHNEVGMVHGDLKPENLLLKEQNCRKNVVLADFGCAHETQCVTHDLPSSASLSNKTTSGGTTAYYAPERFGEITVVTPAMDMWSAGVILYILLTSSHPFDVDGTSTDEEIQDCVCALSETSSPVFAQGVSLAAQDVLAGLLAIDPQDRTSASNLLQHPWILEHCQPSIKTDSTSTANVSQKNNILGKASSIDCSRAAPVSAPSLLI